jgi:LPXTG-site transpeptidase (sortase) family protein
MRRVLPFLLWMCIASWGVFSADAQISLQSQIFTGPLDAVAFSPDGRLIASGGRDNLVRLWDAASGVNLAQMTGHTNWVTRIAFSPDGTKLISGSNDSTVRLWDVANYALLQTFTQHTAPVTGVAFSPDGLLMASGGMDGNIWIADIAGNTLGTLTNYSGAVWGIAFSPDSHLLASGSEDGTVWVWGLYDSSVIPLRGHTGAVTALAFSPDGTQLATSSWDRSARLWDLSTQTEIRTLTGHEGPVTGIYFGDNAAELITASLDGTVRLWSSTSGEQQLVMQSTGSALASFALIDEQVVAAGIDGVLTLWDISTWQDAPVVVEASTDIPPTDAPVVAVAPTALPATDVPLIAQIPTAAPATIPPLPTQPPPAPTSSTISTNEPVSVDEVEPPPVDDGISLSIPTVNIYAPIITFYLDGVSWAIDPWEHNIGHLQGTAWVSAPGNIALGGHSEYPDGTPGIFNGLYGVNVGDPVFLNVLGTQRRYVVTNKRTVQYNDLSVIYPTTSDQLTLITCDIPSYDAASNFYSERLVVVAVPG